MITALALSAVAFHPWHGGGFWFFLIPLFWILAMLQLAFSLTLAWLLLVKWMAFLWFRLHQGWTRFVGFHDLLSISQAVTYQGTATVHESDDVKAWFYPALAARVRPDSAEQQAAFVHHLDTPGRVVIEVVPGKRIGFDSEQMFKNSPAGPTRTKV